MPQRMVTNSVPVVGVADHGSRVVRKYTRHGREVAYVPIDHTEERDNSGLVVHSTKPFPANLISSVFSQIRDADTSLSGPCAG